MVIEEPEKWVRKSYSAFGLLFGVVEWSNTIDRLELDQIEAIPLSHPPPMKVTYRKSIQRMTFPPHRKATVYTGTQNGVAFLGETLSSLA